MIYFIYAGSDISRMQPTVEYCQVNDDAELKAIRAEVDGDHIQRCCLEQCGICRQEPFLVIDGTLARGEVLPETAVEQGSE